MSAHAKFEVAYKIYNEYLVRSAKHNFNHNHNHNFWIEHLSLLWEILPKVQWVSVPFSNQKEQHKQLKQEKQDDPKMWANNTNLFPNFWNCVVKLLPGCQLSRSYHTGNFVITNFNISNNIINNFREAIFISNTGESVSDKAWQWSDSGPKRLFSSLGGRSRSLILLTTDVCRLAQQLYIRYYPVTVENIFCFVFCDSVSCIFSWVFRNILCQVVNLSNWKSFCFPSVDTLFSRNICTEGGF